MFKTKCTQGNKVIIYIWTSGFNRLHSGQNVGHVAVSISGLTMKNPKYDSSDESSKKEIPLYISLWPAEDFKLGNKGSLQPVGHEFNLSYKEDCEDEVCKQRPKGVPELTICLYSLKINFIRKEFLNICFGKSVKKGLKGNKNFKGWVLIGGNKLINRNSGESCASLAYKLLQAGGIDSLINFSSKSRIASIVSPDELAEVVKNAKRTELKNYPETKIFVHEGESSLQDITRKKISCNIM